MQSLADTGTSSCSLHDICHAQRPKCMHLRLYCMALCMMHDPPYTIELAAEAIRGHRSAHSFATGPVIAEPRMERRRRVRDYKSDRQGVLIPLLEQFDPPHQQPTQQPQCLHRVKSALCKCFETDGLVPKL